MNEVTEPPIEWLRVIAVAIVTLALLMPSLVSADTGTVRVFYYGSSGDGYLGMHHAAFWHGETPEGWPRVVDLVHYGIATSDWSIPFGTELCLEIVGLPAWTEGEYTERIGVIVCGIVIDRMPAWVEWCYGESIDVWPALAYALMGPDFRRIGTVEVEICSVRYPQLVREDRMINGFWRHQ